MENNPDQSPGRKEKDPAPNKLLLVRKILDVATATVKLINEILHLGSI